MSKFLSVLVRYFGKLPLDVKKVAAVFAWIHQLLNLFVINVTLHAKRGLKSLSVNREIYFTVSLRETKISRREFKISRRVHLGLDLFHS